MAPERPSAALHDAPLLVAFAAAVLAAVTVGVAAALTSAANDERQVALRREVQRAAAITTASQYIYLAEGFRLFALEAVDVRAEELRRVLPSAGGAAGLVQAEAEVEEAVAFTLRLRQREAERDGGAPASLGVGEVEALRDDEGIIDLGRAFARELAARGPEPGEPEQAAERASRLAGRATEVRRGTWVAAGAFAIGMLGSALRSNGRVVLAGVAAVLLVAAVAAVGGWA